MKGSGGGPEAIELESYVVDEANFSTIGAAREIQQIWKGRILEVEGRKDIRVVEGSVFCRYIR